MSWEALDEVADMDSAFQGGCEWTLRPSYPPLGSRSSRSSSTLIPILVGPLKEYQLQVASGSDNDNSIQDRHLRQNLRSLLWAVGI